MIALKGLTKIYETKGNATVRALDGVDITLEDHGLVFILGKSGSGKSTLLNVMGGLDSPDTGEIIVDGVSSKNFSQADFDGYRNTYVGFIFQEFNILDEFSVGENIALSLRLQNLPCSHEKVNEILELVDLKGLYTRSPRTLSGGQKQRVAIARALIKDPKIILADEPTGSLDSNTGKQVFSTLKKLSNNKLVVVVSHDREFASTYGDRIIELSDGKVVSDVKRVETDGEVEFKNVILSETSLFINDTSKISDSDSEKIIDTIKAKGKKAIITFGDSEVEEVKKVIKAPLKEYSKGTFEPTKPLPEVKASNGKKNFVKSKLPFRHALKMGVSGFKAKPIRFGFTVFLSVIAFCLFGVLSTLMFYTPAYSVSRALSENNYRSIAMSNSYNYIERFITVKSNGTEIIEGETEDSEKTLFGTEEIAKLNDNDLGLEFAGVFNLSSPLNTNASLRFDGLQISENYSKYFAKRETLGFSDCGEDYLLRNGAELLYGRYPTEDTSFKYLEVAVSEYVYELYKSSQRVTSYHEFVTETVIDVTSSSGAKYHFRPVGIYRISDLSKYERVKDASTEEYKNMLSAEQSSLLFELYETVENSLDTVIYVAPNFYDVYKEGIADISFLGDLKSHVAKKINLGLVKPETYAVSLNFYTEKIYENAKDRFSFFDVHGERKTYTPNENEIWVPKSVYLNWLEAVGGQEGALHDRQISVLNKNGQEVVLILAGYYEMTGASSATRYLVTHEFLYKNAQVEVFRPRYKITNYQPPLDAKYNFVVAPCDNSLSQVSYILAERNGTFMEMQNEVYRKLYGGQMISSLNSLKKIFMIAGLAVGVLASLMLYNFISTSIATKRKEMGILRAVGAGRSDVFRIFFTESVVLAFICFLIASIFSGVAGFILNGALYKIFAMQVVQYGLKNICLILFVSFAISLLATIFPVILEAKKSPVESIRQL